VRELLDLRTLAANVIGAAGRHSRKRPERAGADEFAGAVEGKVVVRGSAVALERVPAEVLRRFVGLDERG